MKSWNTKNTIVHQILGFRSNSFLVSNGNIHIIIDTGWKKSRRKLTSRLEALLGSDILSYLIITHAHFDHTENAAYLKDRFNCKIIIHESEAEYLKQGTGQKFKRHTNHY